MADRLCKGCGKTYGTFRSYNAHHSRTDAKPGCRGRHNEQSATATVNSRSYRVVVRDSSFHPEADSDHSRAESDLESAAGSLAGPPLQAGPGPRLAGGRSAPRPALADADGAGHDGGWPGRPGTARPPQLRARREALADLPDSEEDLGFSEGPATSGPPRPASGSHGPADGPGDGGAGGMQEDVDNSTRNRREGSTFGQYISDTLAIHLQYTTNTFIIFANTSVV